MQINSILTLHISEAAHVEAAARRLRDAGFEVKISQGRDMKNKPCLVLATNAGSRELREARQVDPDLAVANLLKILATITAAAATATV